MKLVYGFDTIENSKLSEFCQISKEFYNQANYIARQEYIKNGICVRSSELETTMKTTTNLQGEINYRRLKAQVAQQLLMLLDRNWTSYFESLRSYNKEPNKFSGKPKIPGYKKKEFLLIYTNQACIIKGDGFIHFSKKFKLRIPQFEKYKDEILKFQQIRVLPKSNGYRIEIVYNFEPIKIELDPSKHIGIDLGVNNFATVTSNLEKSPIIFSGKILKSKNQTYNKKLAKLKSIRTNGHNAKKEPEYFKSTKLMRALTQKRNNQIKDILHKISKQIINYCIKNHVSKIIIGSSSDWKSHSDIGKKNNQNFQLLPFKTFIHMLEYKSQMFGIELVETEESYTSKCSALDLEALHKKEYYYGTRSKRGLYRTSEDQLINADINGSLNIMRKVVGDSFVGKLDKGLLFNPLMIRNVFNHSNSL